jgi:predicted ester cyclase
VSTEENKALVRRFVDEVQSAGNINAINELCLPEFVNHSALPRVPPNCEGARQLTVMFRRAFPDSYFSVNDIITEGDKSRRARRFTTPTRGIHGHSCKWANCGHGTHRYRAHRRWEGRGALVYGR